MPCRMVSKFSLFAMHIFLIECDIDISHCMLCDCLHWKPCGFFTLKAMQMILLNAIPIFLVERARWALLNFFECISGLSFWMHLRSFFLNAIQVFLFELNSGLSCKRFRYHSFNEIRILWNDIQIFHPFRSYSLDQIQIFLNASPFFLFKCHWDLMDRICCRNSSNFSLGRDAERRRVLPAH